MYILCNRESGQHFSQDKKAVIMSLDLAFSEENIPPVSQNLLHDDDTAERAATSTLSRREHEDLCHVFALFDTDQTGCIDIGELRSVLQELNGELSSASHNLQRLLVSLESLPLSMLLSLDDFIRLLTTPNQADTRDEWEKIFDLFDESGKGYITVDDLAHVAKDLGETMGEDELRAMIYRAEKSGRVTLEKFNDIMNKKLFS